MAWTFIANSENQATLADALQLAANNFDARKGEMYGKIDSMGEHWKGEDYDLFNSNAHNYDNALSDFSDSIRMYSKQFLTISSATEQLAAELVSIIMNMTGSGGAAGGGGAAAAGAAGAAAGAATGGAAAAGAAGAAIGAGAGAAGAASGNRKWYQKMGDRYVSDWNDFTGDVSDAWSRADGLISGATALGFTGIEAVNFVGDAAISTGQAGVDCVQNGVNWLFDGGRNREYSFTQDIAENWDYSKVDGFWEGAGVTVGGLVSTSGDLVQGGANLVCDVTKSVATGSKKLWDGACDVGRKALGWILG